MNPNIFLKHIFCIISFSIIIVILIIHVNGIPVKDSKVSWEWREQRGIDILIINAIETLHERLP